MDIDKLQSLLASANPEDEMSMRISFVKKRKNSSTAYIPIIGRDLRENLLKLFSDSLHKKVYHLKQEPYNELGREDDVLEVSDLEVGKIKAIIESNNNQENRCYNLSELNIDKINYYMVEVLASQEKIYFFRRFNKQKKLRKGIRGYFNGNSFVKVEDEVIGIEDDIDIIVYLEEALIINRYSLQTIFDLSDYFLEKTDKAMREIERFRKINNFKSFEDDCKNDGTAVKRLTKIVNTPELINGFFDNIEHLPGVIADMDLAIKLDEDNNIDYSGTPEERTQILSCIADKYYITLLQGKVGEDKLK